jgi:hypothetical protein
MSGWGTIKQVRKHSPMALDQVPERLTAAELRKLQSTSKGGVQRVAGAQRTTVDGITFDSKREADRYSDLKMMERAGLIQNLTLQHKIALHGRDGPILTPTGRQMHYIADFSYEDENGNTVEWDMPPRGLYPVVIVDAKGYPTEIYTLKKAILAAMGVEIVEV